MFEQVRCEGFAHGCKQKSVGGYVSKQDRTLFGGGDAGTVWNFVLLV